MSWKDIIKYDDYYDEIDHRIYMAQGPQAEIVFPYNVYAVLFVPTDENKPYMYMEDWAYDNLLYHGEILNINWKTESPQTIDQQIKNKFETDFRNEMNEISKEDYERVKEYRDDDDGKLYYVSPNEYVYRPKIKYAVHVEYDDFNIGDDDGMRTAGLIFDTIEEAIERAKELESQVN